MTLGIRDFKVYMPAKDFELSKRFYAALGFTMSEGWGGTADFELSGQRFRLQNYYVKDWADNFMVVIGVDDAEAWHQHVRRITAGGEFPGIRVTPPEKVDGALVLHVWDVGRAAGVRAVTRPRRANCQQRRAESSWRFGWRERVRE